MIKVCAEHALTTRLHAYEHKSIMACGASAAGTGSGDTDISEGESQTQHRDIIQNHDCFIVPLKLKGSGAEVGKWTVLTNKLHGKLQSEVRLVTAIVSSYSIRG